MDAIERQAFTALVKKVEALEIRVTELEDELDRRPAKPVAGEEDSPSLSDDLDIVTEG